MNIENLRFEAAEALGWERTTHADSENEAEEALDAYFGLFPGAVVWKTPEGKYVRHLPPNYPEDLNAIHDAWKTLDKIQHAQFKHFLREIIINQEGFEGPCKSITNASALARCEAFVRAHKLPGGKLFHVEQSEAVL